jgi:hypothetical protein
VKRKRASRMREVFTVSLVAGFGPTVTDSPLDFINDPDPFSSPDPHPDRQLSPELQEHAELFHQAQMIQERYRQPSLPAKHMNRHLDGESERQAFREPMAGDVSLWRVSVKASSSAVVIIVA